MLAGGGWKGSRCETGLQSLPAESELEIITSVSTVSVLLHCTFVIHKGVLSRKLHYLLPAKVTAEPFRRFLALPVGGASPEAVQTFLIHRGEVKPHLSWSR